VKRRRILLIAGGIIVVFVIAMVVWPREREPEYQGKKLSEWVLEYQTAYKSGYPAREKATEAIDHIGTNAVPWLLKWIDYGRPSSRAMLLSAANKPNFRNLWLARRERERAEYECAIGHLGFEILGPQAKSAVPELTKLISTSNWQPTSIPAMRAVSAMHALRSIGGDALQPLVAVVNNAALPLGMRFQAVQVLGYGPGFGHPRFPVDVRSAVPALVSALSDSDVGLRSMATNALLTIAPEVLTNGVSGEH
jgi:hypothetical protein